MRMQLWRPGNGIPHGTRRSGTEVREILKQAAMAPQIDMYPRSDGPGSSLDLPQFAAMGLRVWSGPAALEDPTWSWSDGSLRTIGACLDAEPIRFRAVPSDSE